MPGYPGAPSVQTVTDKLAVIAPELGNVAGIYVYLREHLSKTVYESANPTDSGGNWSIASVPAGMYQYSYGIHPNTAYEFKGSYLVALNPVSTVVPTIDGIMSVWYRALSTNPANCYLLFSGDSTSYEPIAPAIFSRLRSLHTKPGNALAGMTADPQHIVAGGNNGMTLVGWWATAGLGTHSYVDGSGTFLYADVKALYATAEAAGGHLCLIFGWGINDLRTVVDQIGITGSSYLSFVALMNTVLTQMRADMPNVTIVLRIPNNFSTDNAGSLNFITDHLGNVNPAGGGQALTDALRNAYLSFTDVWPNVVVWNAQDRIFSRTAIVSTATDLLGNQLHPSATGYVLIADHLTADLVGLPLPFPAPKYGTLPHGIINTTRTPWTVDPRAVEDAAHFQLIGEYELFSSSTTALVFGPVLAFTVQVNDLIEFNGLTAQIPSGVGFSSSVSGGSIPNLTITGFGAMPAAWQNLVATQGKLRVYRELDQGDLQIGAYRAQLDAARAGFGPNRFIRLGRILNGATNFAIIGAEPATPGAEGSIQWAVNAATDSIYVAGTVAATALSAYAVVYSGANQLQINGTTRDFTNDIGKLCVIVGAHPGETSGDRLDHVSVAAGTVNANTATDVAVTYTGARFVRPWSLVVVQPEAIPPAGIVITAFVSAADQVTVRVANVTIGNVVVGTVFVSLELLR